MLKQEVNINYFYSDSYILSASKTTTQGTGGGSLAFIIQNTFFFDSIHRYVLAVWVIF